MKVKIVKETTLVNYGLLERGQIVESDNKLFTEKTLQRWVKRGIAVETQEQPKKETYIPEKEAMKQLGIKEEEVKDEVKIEQMGFRDLRRYAKEHGYKEYGKMNRDELIEMLTEQEEVEEKSPFFDGVE